MRPRPDATENEVLRRFEDAGELASMRPRPDATENRLAPRGHFRPVLLQ